MLISMNWINEFVDLSGLDTEALIHRFTLSTAEVEEVFHMGGELKDIVVGKILTVENHPDSKKLHLLTVDGGDKIYDVVCGAPNVRVGLVIPFVKEGGKAGGMDITAAKIAGYMSYGMCCSESELGISADHGGLMELPDTLTIGTSICDVYNIVDTVFEVDNKSLTNRPDLWGHYGIAREFAALTGRQLKPVERLDLAKYAALAPINIDIQDQRCQRYTGLKMRNITKKTSPVNMRIRLFYCGTRAINLLADLTNYLMLELGQPMHAFDSRKVNAIVVKPFSGSFTTLDGVKRSLDENTMMICSEKEPVAIAGIMGGLDSEIEDDTSSLLLESACFDAVATRKTSTKLGLRTDASMRYEKTLDPENTVIAAERFAKLLTDIDSSAEICSSLTDIYKMQYPVISLTFTKRYVDRYTGIEIANGSIIETLNALGFEASVADDVFRVTIPTWRATKDVTIKADIIEEITRIYGYDNFKIDTAKSALFPVLASAGRSADNFAKDILVSKYNLHEVHSYLWCDSKKYKELGIETPENVSLLNSINPDFTVIRDSLSPTLLSFVNENKGYAQDFGIFEIGRVADGLKENGECNEQKRLGIALYSRILDEKSLYMKLRDMISTMGISIKHRALSFTSGAPTHNWQHPMNTASILLDGNCIGFMNTLYPTVKNKLDKKAAIVTAEIDMTAFSAPTISTTSYAEPSKYPGIDIDLSLCISRDTVYNDLAKSFDNVTPLLKNVSLIDLYESAEKSLTLRFSFCSDERTLSKAEVQVFVDEILKKLSVSGIQLKM